MTRRLRFRCPVCGKPLTKRQFDRALRIHEARQEHVEQRIHQLQEERRSFEARKRELMRKAREAEQARTLRIVGNKEKKIVELRETIKLLKRGKAPQDAGPEFEVRLLKHLRADFGGDEIRHEGRQGDVLQVVKDGGRVAGTIIYECKWTPRISGSHVEQAARAKVSRRAEFAVLVTSGTRRGFAGFTEMSGVLVIAPAGVLALAGLLRKYLIEMLRAGIERARRARIANRLLRFIKSAEFKNPIEEVVRTAEHLTDGVKEEYRWHVSDWKKRMAAYETIRWDGWAVQENLRRVFRGETHKLLTQPKQKLALPAPVTG